MVVKLLGSALRAGIPMLQIVSHFIRKMGLIPLNMDAMDCMVFGIE
ncbi:unnamed protein product [Brassica rapa subsp. trilocularis]